MAFTWLGLDAIHSNFVVLDEFGHVPAGISYWQLGQFRLYRENPPAIQALAGLPGLFGGAKVNYAVAGPRRSEWIVGQAFLAENGERLYQVFHRSRYVILALGAACGLMIFLWARELYGPWVAAACAALWLLDPNVLAFSTIVTSDVGSATLGTLSCYAFWKFLQQPSWLRATASGIALGLAQASKFNLLALYPAFLVLTGLSLCRRWPDLPTVRIDYLVRRLGALALVSLLVLNALYRFDGTFTPLGAFEFRSHSLSGCPAQGFGAQPTGNRLRGTVFEALPSPLPRDYLLGLDSQRWEAEVGLTYFRGDQKASGGPWYGPFRTLALKLPVGSMLIFIAGVIAWLGTSNRRRFAGWAFGVPAFTLLAVLCTQSGLNWPVRYAISVLPFLAIGTGQALVEGWSSRPARVAIIVCLLWSLADALRVAPHFLSYGNTLAGGPSGAYNMFHGSNYDWGQDLLRLKRWYEEHPDLRPFVVSYYGVVPPDYVNIPAGTLPPTFAASDDSNIASPIKPCTFYWAISANLLRGMSGVFPLHGGTTVHGVIRASELKPENAMARIGYSIFIFRVDLAPSSVSHIPVVARRSLEPCIEEVPTESLGLDAAP